MEEFRIENTEKVGKYRVCLRNRIIAYHDDINQILFLYRRPHELFEGGEILVFNKCLMDLDFTIMKLKLVSDRNKRHVVSIEKEEIDSFGFNFPLHTKQGIEKCIGIRLNHFKG